MENKLKERIILDVLENIPKKYKHNKVKQQKKEFFLFRAKVESQLDNIKIFVTRTSVIDYYDVELSFYQSKPHIISIELRYTMKGISELAKNNLKHLRK